MPRLPRRPSAKSSSAARASRRAAAPESSRAAARSGRRRGRGPLRPGAAGAAKGRHLAIVTGLSGSGKGAVIKAFEDSGYYCVDNLPVDLLPTFVELVRRSGEIARAALVIDIREGQRLETLPRLVEQLRRSDLPTTLVFLEADDAVLLRRFSETRRPHPLATGKDQDRNLIRGIRAERKFLAKIREAADLVVDTSKFNPHELRAFVTERVIQADASRALRIGVGSFGFRHGLPIDADLVFDVRFLPNPNYIPQFRNRTGKDPAVAKYIASFPQTKEFIDRITALLVYLIPHYIEEGKSYLTIAFGCTGGQHRSVMIAEAVRKGLADAGYSVKVSHRDIGK